MDQKIKKISIGGGIVIMAILGGIAIAFINKNGSPESGRQPEVARETVQSSDPPLRELLQSVSSPASLGIGATSTVSASSQTVKTITAPTGKAPVSTTVPADIIDSLSAPAK